jgi:antitoxin component YwqK of YwqJK toxin-antitoxin module
MKVTFYILFLVILIVGCRNEIVLTEQTIPDEILYIENSRIPYTGKCLIYYNQTKLVHYTLNYENGILNGPFESFFKSGQTQYKGTYYDGELTGRFLKYNEDGLMILNCNLDPSKVQ